VSHDRYFIDKIATRIWAIGEGELTSHLGNYTDFQRGLGRRQELAKKDGKETPQKEVLPAQTVAAPVAPAGNGRNGSRPISDAKAQKMLVAAEREISKLEGKLNEISDALAVASIDADTAALARLGVEYERTQEELEAAYAKWEEVSVIAGAAVPVA